MKLQINIIEGPADGKSYVFSERGVIVFGRGRDCDVSLSEDMSVSRRHFAIEVDWPEIRIRDLDSLNGILVNGIRHGGRNKDSEAAGAQYCRQALLLNQGDLVRVGNTGIRILVEGRAEGLKGGRSSARSQLGASQLIKIAGYTVKEKIGSGGFATVYKALRKADGEPVAIKVISPKVIKGERAMQAALREIECLKKLHHPNLVSFLDSGEVENTLYCVMEYCPGGTAADLAERCGGRLTAEQALPLLLQSLRALSYIHVMGYVHRDLKPSNILIVPSGGGAEAKISDFGLAKKYETAGLSRITGKHFVAGSCRFMPPEQVTDFLRVKPPADVWSLGATFYNLLTGAFPHDFPSGADPLAVVLNSEVVPLRERSPQPPPWLAGMIDTALRMDPGRRYKDAGEMLKTLRAALASLEGT